MTPSNIAELLGTEITEPEAVQQLPVGAGVVDDDGMLWQLGHTREWFPANGVAESLVELSMLRHSPTLLLVWLPPEATR